MLCQSSISRFLIKLGSIIWHRLFSGLFIYLIILGNPGFTSPLKYEGHGGPIRGVAISSSLEFLATTSFDYSVLLWQAGRVVEVQQLIGHEAAVNVAKFSFTDKQLATAGDDGKILLWKFHSGDNKFFNSFILNAHTAKIVDLDFSNDSRYLASAGWDHAVRIWDTNSGEAIKLLKGHIGPVNAVSFSEDGEFLYTAGYDGTIRYWRISDKEELRSLVDNGWGINVMEANEKTDLLLYGTTDGRIRIQKLSSGKLFLELREEGTPVSAINYYPEENKAVFGTMKGRVIVIDTRKMEVEKDFLAVNGPVWDVVYHPQKQSVFIGGLDDFLTEWILTSFHSNYFVKGQGNRRFQETDAMSNGALQFARKCSICHTLDSKKVGRRAGPPLHGVFGRKAGTISDYPYSDALLKSDIIWSEETISRLFEKGPEIVTPGTKMPIQKIKKNKDRLDLINFLKDATRTN